MPTDTVFQFKIGPTYHRTSLNFYKMGFKHGLRSLVVNKYRYLTRLIRYRWVQKKLNKYPVTELAAMTAIVRPGVLRYSLKG